MEDVVHFTTLYDIYKNVLTARQREIFESYFFENFTLDEIAQFDGVSKSSVAKTMKQVKEALEECEGKLHFKEYRDKLENEFKNEEDILNRILKYDNIVS